MKLINEELKKSCKSLIKVYSDNIASLIETMELSECNHPITRCDNLFAGTYCEVCHRGVGR